MAVDGSLYMLPGELRQRLADLDARRSDLAAELHDVEVRRQVLIEVLALAEGATPPTQHAEVTETAHETPAEQEGVSRSTRDLIIQVLAAQPPGATTSTRRLYETLVERYGYSASMEAVRRAAQRLCDAGIVTRHAKGMWSLPTGGDTGG